MSLSIFTEWVSVSWPLVKGYRIEFRTVSGVKQQRHHWLNADGTTTSENWIKALS